MSGLKTGKKYRSARKYRSRSGPRGEQGGLAGAAAGSPRTLTTRRPAPAGRGGGQTQGSGGTGRAGRPRHLGRAGPGDGSALLGCQGGRAPPSPQHGARVWVNAGTTGGAGMLARGGCGRRTGLGQRLLNCWWNLLDRRLRSGTIGAPVGSVKYLGQRILNELGEPT